MTKNTSNGSICNFLLNLKKILTESYKLLKGAMVRILHLGHAFLNGNEWFYEGQESTENDQCPNGPVFVLTTQTVAKINEIVGGDCCMNIQMIAKTVNADKETVRKMLHDDLNMKKVFMKLVPTNLTTDQKLANQQIYSYFLESVEEQLELMENIIT